MKIVFIGYDVNPESGGIQNYCYNNLQYLKEEHKIITYLLKSPPNDVLADVSDTHISKTLFDNGVLTPYKLFLKLKNEKPDFILCGHLNLAPIAEKLSGLLGIKYHLYVYGIDCWGRKFEERLGIMTNLDKVISISSFTSEQIVKQGFDEEDIVYVPPVTELPDIAGRGKHSSDDNFVLLSVGRLDASEQYKGQDVVINALPKITQHVPGVEYWIVGEGDDRARLERLVKDNGLGERVTFFGFVPNEPENQLRKIYMKSDVFIMPSRVSLDPDNLEGEGFGIVFIEAGAVGTPLIGPNEGGPTDIIQDGYNGYSVDPRSPEEIAKKVIELAQNPEKKEEMGKNARKVVKERFSKESLGDYLDQLIE